MPLPHIHLLTAEVANKIAAGEVVDRPASVLKELMENSIDAGARQIDVDVVAGGRKLLAVTDDGGGMNRDDALLAIERHATSKIHDVGDIERIATMGFRGEALAAISSVSRFSLKTCAEGEEAGTEVVMAGGRLQDVRDIGFPRGCRIEVRDLFFNVPARRKFLRSYPTELAHVRDAFVVQALAHPEVGLRLGVDGRETYLLAVGSSLEDRLRDLFGPAYVANLLPVRHAGGGVTVEGYISLPTCSRMDRNEQYIFINRRPGSAPVLGYAVREAYQSLLENGRHPAVFLFLGLDPGEVDVNVHPTKKEVRFRDSGVVRDAVLTALRTALERTRGPAATGAGASAPALSDGAPPAPTPLHEQLTIENLPLTRSFRYPRIPLVQPVADGGAAFASTSAPGAAEAPPAGAVGAPAAPAAPAAGPPAAGEAPWSWCRVLGQIGGLYVIMETEEGLVLMDPHAAHERVLFDRFMREVRAGAVSSQGLLPPESVDLPPRDAQLVRQNLELLTGMGFGISEFGADAFVVDAMPVCLGARSAAALLVDVAHSLEQGGGRGGRDTWHVEAVAQSACKAAVKARDRLTLAEIEALVVELARTEMPYTCPHGRPTMILTSYRELGRKFGRE